MKSMNTELQYPYFLYMKNKFGAIVDEKIIKINALILFRPPIRHLMSTDQNSRNGLDILCGNFFMWFSAWCGLSVFRPHLDRPFRVQDPAG